MNEREKSVERASSEAGFVGMDDASFDRALIELQEGNRHALSVIYEGWGRMILAVACRVAGIGYGQVHQAEDILQEVMVKILKQIHNYRRHSCPRAWVMTITRSCALDYRKKHPQTVPLEEAGEIAHPGFLPDPDAEALRQVLATLPDDDRLLLQLRNYVGLSHKEIAQVMGLKESAVRKRYSRILQVLKERLSDSNEKGGTLS